MDNLSKKSVLPDNIIFYSFYHTKYDKNIIDNDFLCVIREKYFCSNKKLRSKKLIYRGSSVYQYSYNISPKAPLKWKKIKDGVMLEEVNNIRNKYAIVSHDEDNADVIIKKQLFYNNHALIGNEYFTNNILSIKLEIKDNNELMLYSIDNDCKSETVLYPCEFISDPLKRKRIIDTFGEPEVIATTNYGKFYFCNKELLREINSFINKESFFNNSNGYSESIESNRATVQSADDNTNPIYKVLLSSGTLKIKSADKEYYYFGKVNNSKREGFGYTVMANGNIAYNGHYKDNKRNGFGVYYFENGRLCYVGNWKDNKKNDMGIQFSSNNDNFSVCSWKDNEPIGNYTSFDSKGQLTQFGTITNNRQKTSRVIYLKDKDYIFIPKNGTHDGVLFDSEGNMLYKGKLSDGKKEGKGILYDKSGKTVYIGEFKADKFDGVGALRLENGHILKTVFKEGNIVEKVLEFDKSGFKVYEGEWSNNNRNGQGCLYFKNGGKYQGCFKDGFPKGVMKGFDRNGKLIYEGECEKGHFSGHGIYYINGEKFYEGDFYNDKFNGQGRLYKNGQIIYSGHFSNGVKYGFGTSYANGNPIYAGEWKNNLYDGVGAICKDNEILFCGEFSKGKKNGRINAIKNGIVSEEQVYKNGMLAYTKKIDVSNPQEAHLLYIGNIKNNVPNGMGCIFDKYCGKQEEGLFENGRLIKQMKICFDELKELPKSEYLKNTAYDSYRKSVNIVVEKNMPDGYIYSGLLDENNRPYGIATALYTDHVYIGNFKAGIAYGKGIIYTNDGCTIQGEFVPIKTSDSIEYTFNGNLTYFCIKDE